MMKHGEYYYAFYAAAACCGEGCSYQSGVARSKSLTGPWEKYAKNPILINEGDWKCPGHGTPIEKEGRFYFMYHAYHKDAGVFTGRQGLIKEFRFTPDGWIEFIDAVPQTTAIDKDSKDEFSGKTISEEWQWIVFQKVKKQQKSGNLELFALPQAGGAVLGRKMYAADFDAMVEVNRKGSTAASGIGLIGDEKNSISAFIKGSAVQIVQVKDGKETLLSTHSIGSFKLGHLKMQVRNGKDISFYYGNRENNFTLLNKKPIDGKFLPPWDRALRIGLVAKGPKNEKAVFEEFEVDYLTK
jgi:beta-xylosidase